MKKSRLLLLVAMVAVFLFGTVQGTRATVLDQTDNNYRVGMKAGEIGVCFMDGEKEATELTFNLGKEIGYHYDESVTIKNTGAIDEYLRLVITTKWVDKDGSRLLDLDPDYINYELDLGEGWKESTKSFTESRVYYYTKVLEPGKELSLTGESWISTDVLKLSPKTVETKTDGNKVTTVYVYDKVFCEVTLEVDGVQTHNYEKAVVSAWGNEALKAFN